MGCLHSARCAHCAPYFLRRCTGGLVPRKIVWFWIVAANGQSIASVGRAVSGSTGWQGCAGTCRTVSTRRRMLCRARGAVACTTRRASRATREQRIRPLAVLVMGCGGTHVAQCFSQGSEAGRSAALDLAAAPGGTAHWRGR
eukprot:gene11654-biopygen16883